MGCTKRGINPDAFASPVPWVDRCCKDRDHEDIGRLESDVRIAGSGGADKKLPALLHGLASRFFSAPLGIYHVMPSALHRDQFS